MAYANKQKAYANKEEEEAPLPAARHACEDRVLDGPASGEKGSKGGAL